MLRPINGWSWSDAISNLPTRGSTVAAGRCRGQGIPKAKRVLCFKMIAHNSSAAFLNVSDPVFCFSQILKSSYSMGGSSPKPGEEYLMPMEPWKQPIAIIGPCRATVRAATIAPKARKETETLGIVDCLFFGWDIYSSFSSWFRELVLTQKKRFRDLDISSSCRNWFRDSVITPKKGSEVGTSLLQKLVQGFGT
ncbi:hypothetical protein HYC85_031442 [Camellia sinensis]|uniref:Uncharacterized protein n=1 Tax=Camellia sinensis TaxID=4442 RepID=A0A7J7FQT5_CAMSI|nr:hypothetical protein HYC85_031442 [Camellia sinensis]